MNARTGGGSPLEYAREAGGVYLFGAGGFARDTARALRSHQITVHGLLVSDPATRDQWEGIPILPIGAAHIGSFPVWVAVLNRESHSDYGDIQSVILRFQPEARIVWPQGYYGYLQEQLGWRFWLTDASEYRNVGASLSAVRSMWADEQSRQAFDAVVRFRSQSEGWTSPRPSQEPQYMPSWLQSLLTGSVSMVDAGAYHGETLREVASLIHLSQAWAFEPDLENYRVLARDTSALSFPVVNLPVGLGEACHTAHFEAGAGDAARVAASGSSSIPIVALDECLKGSKIDLLKLDVEGHELPVLAGARRTIQRCRPVIAVAAYHRWDDLWRIPFFLAKLQPTYQFRICLHAHNSFESVIYAY